MTPEFISVTTRIILYPKNLIPTIPTTTNNLNTKTSKMRFSTIAVDTEDEKVQKSQSLTPAPFAKKLGQNEVSKFKNLILSLRISPVNISHYLMTSIYKLITRLYLRIKIHSANVMLAELIKKWDILILLHIGMNKLLSSCPLFREPFHWRHHPERRLNKWPTYFPTRKSKP